MKKMMMAMAIVIVSAVSASAAVVNWGLLNRMQYEGSYQTGATCQLYLVTAGGNLLIDERTTLANPPAQTGALGLNFSSMQSSYAYGQTVGDTLINESAQVYMVVYNAAGTHYQQSAAVTLGSLGLSDTTIATHQASFNWTSGWVPIPEPTAMALLALGAAAVGLRRRFRK